MEKFYYVITDNGLRLTKEHPTYNEALKEAERLVLEEGCKMAEVAKVQARVMRAAETIDIFPKAV